MTDIHNLAYRVSINGVTVLHLGDSDSTDRYYAAHQEHWDERTLNVAFPPYWFVYSPQGQQVLTHRLKPLQVIGIHVPAAMPDHPEPRPEYYRGPDLFTTPGESRQIDLQ